MFTEREEIKTQGELTAAAPAEVKVSLAPRRYLSSADLHQTEGVGNCVPSHRGVSDSRAIDKLKAQTPVNCLEQK